MKRSSASSRREAAFWGRYRKRPVFKYISSSSDEEDNSKPQTNVNGESIAAISSAPVENSGKRVTVGPTNNEQVESDSIVANKPDSSSSGKEVPARSSKNEQVERNSIVEIKPDSSVKIKPRNNKLNL